MKKRKPHSMMGYEIQVLFRDVREKHHGSMFTALRGYKSLGFGVNGPNIHSTNPRSLRRLGQWLIRAADWIDANKKKTRV